MAETMRMIAYFRIYRESLPGNRRRYTVWSPASSGLHRENRDAPRGVPTLGRLGTKTYFGITDTRFREKARAKELAKAYDLIRRAYPKELSGETLMEIGDGVMVTETAPPPRDEMRTTVDRDAKTVQMDEEVT